MKTAQDLTALAKHLFSVTGGDNFEFMVRMEQQPEFFTTPQSVREMIFILLQERQTPEA